MPTIEILDNGEVVDTILASTEFAESAYPGRWRLAPVQPTETPQDPTAWLIDIGPFFDRFGAAKMAVLTSSDPAVRAILSDLQVRKWIDLKRSDVAQGLQYIGSIIPAVTVALQGTILHTPVKPEENLALRKLYFV